jgi:DNA-binding winged helix-turn-helix (wHTH) protein/pimeloyl-ACP methyl ester carboxylesterase
VHEAGSGEEKTLEEKAFLGVRYSARNNCLIGANEEEIELRPQSLAVFRLLAERADSVVSKNELFESVWGDITVTDGSLVQCVADIRRAIGDNKHRVLRTVPRKGYQLVADSQPTVARVDSKTGVTTRASGRFLMLICACAVIALVAVATIGYRAILSPADIETELVTNEPERENEVSSNSSSTPPEHEAPSLSIRVASGSNPDYAPLLQSTLTELRVALARYPTVRLLDRPDTDYELVLSIDSGGDTGQRLAVETIVASTREVFFADTMDVPQATDAAHQLAIRVAAFASPGGGALSRHLMNVSTKKPADQLTAAECYSHGYECTTCSGEISTLDTRTQICLAKLMQADPDSATTWALKSTLHANEFLFGSGLREPERSVLSARMHRADLAVSAANRAEALSRGDNTAVYWGMGRAYFATCEGEKLRVAVERGLRINPHDPSLLGTFGNWLAYTGYWEEGAELVERALEIEPRHYKPWWLWAIAKGHYNRGEYSKAHEVFLQAFNDRNWISHLTLAYTLPMLGQVQEARLAVKRLQELNPGFTIEKALEFYQLSCFDSSYRSKIKKALIMAGLPSRGSSVDLDNIEIPRVKVIQINGVPLEVLDVGKGEPVIFVHGAMSDYRSWGHYLPPISEKHRYISYTQRYFGSQIWSDENVDVTGDAYADDLAQLIKTLETGPAHIVTWSGGGRVGSIFAAKYPELIKSMIHFEPVSRGLVDNQSPELQSEFQRFNALYAPLFESLNAGDVISAKKRELEAAFEWPLGDFEKEISGVQRIVLDSVNTWQFTPERLEKSKVSCELLGKIRTPTLIVRGEKTNSYWQAVFKKFAECTPGAQMATLYGVKHDGPLRRVEEFSTMIVDFVDRHSGP